jgi:hypothetical protein
LLRGQSFANGLATEKIVRDICTVSTVTTEEHGLWNVTPVKRWIGQTRNRGSALRPG